MRWLLLLLLSFSLALPAQAGGGGGEHKPKPKETLDRKLTSAVSWVSVSPINVAVLRRNRIQGMFLVEFGLDIPDEAMRAKAEATLPRMRDVWLRSMSDFATTRVKIGRQADLATLTSRLQTTTDQMLGGPGAKVLLQQAVVRER